MVNSWNPAPLLVYEDLPGPDGSAFDGFYRLVLHRPGKRAGLRMAAIGANNT